MSSVLSSIFGSPATATPLAAPAQPNAQGNVEAAAERQKAEDMALRNAAGGRQSTIVAGASILDDQKTSGIFAGNRRAASRSMLGG